MAGTAGRTPSRCRGDSAPIVEATSLSKHFGPVQAVSGLSFSLERGTVTGFLGPNGAGKTTTLRMLLGLAVPTSGQVRVFGKTYAERGNPRAGSGRCSRQATSTRDEAAGIICASWRYRRGSGSRASMRFSA